MGATAGRDLYRKMTRRRVAMIATFAAMAVILFVVNCTFYMRWSPLEALQTIFDPGSVSRSLDSVVWSYRIPESCFAVLVGVALGMAGAEMQTVLNNPLAEPYTLGISMAAAFGAALVIGFGFGSSFLGDYAMIVGAFLMSMVACGSIYAVSRRRGSSRTTIILTGVAMLFLFQALVNAVQSLGGKEVANSITFWMFGNLARYPDEMGYVLVLLIVVVLVAMLFAMNMWKLSALKLGDAKVYSMGVDASRLRRNTIIGISVVTAVAVSFTGTIGFVGLVGPHVARMLVGDDQRFLLPMSALCGAVFLCASSVLIKGLDLSLPVGVVTSLIGVPFFLYLVLTRRRSLA